MEHLSDCGLVTDKELLNIQKVNQRSEFLKYVQWIPLSWASSLVVKAYEQVCILQKKDKKFMNFFRVTSKKKDLYETSKMKFWPLKSI